MAQAVQVGPAEEPESAGGQVKVCGNDCKGSGHFQCQGSCVRGKQLTPSSSFPNPN